MSKEKEDRLLKIFKEDLTDLDELRSLFRDVFDASQTTKHILIDGFDKVPRNEREMVFSTLATIDSFSQATVKGFLSSRHDIRNEVDMAFTNYWKRTTSRPKLYGDIATYVDVGIDGKVFEGELTVGNPNLLSETKNVLSDGTYGMFLWVFFQIEDICTQTSDDDIATAIHSLPRDLPETYQRAHAKAVRNSKVAIGK
ncbi:hypothetical protein ABVK25_006616 [Lepraria finkii]|uniref:Uncharacterized protein n=1 Tax=Lepraria finkii TaxID=1340010 RepID=A0ABR4B534_9LECA